MDKKVGIIINKSHELVDYGSNTLLFLLEDYIEQHCDLEHFEKYMFEKAEDKHDI